MVLHATNVELLLILCSRLNLVKVSELNDKKVLTRSSAEPPPKYSMIIQSLVPCKLDKVLCESSGSHFNIKASLGFALKTAEETCQPCIPHSVLACHNET